MTFDEVLYFQAPLLNSQGCLHWWSHPGASGVVDIGGARYPVGSNLLHSRHPCSTVSDDEGVAAP